MKDPRRLSDDTFEPIRKCPKRGNRPEHRRAIPYRCNGKNTYRSPGVAQETRGQLLSRGRAAFLRVYRCPHCNRWHLTHHPLRKRA